MAAIEKLAQLVSDPQVRDLLFGLSEKVDDEARARVANVVIQLTAEACGADGTLTRVAIRPISTDDVRNAVGDEAIAELASYMRQSPAETADQLAVVLPDVLDASGQPSGSVDPGETHRALRVALAAGASTARPFASDPG